MVLVVVQELSLCAKFDNFLSYTTVSYAASLLALEAPSLRSSWSTGMGTGGSGRRAGITKIGVSPHWHKHIGSNSDLLF